MEKFIVFFFFTINRMTLDIKFIYMYEKGNLFVPKEKFIKIILYKRKRYAII